MHRGRTQPIEFVLARNERERLCWPVSGANIHKPTRTVDPGGEPEMIAVCTWRLRQAPTLHSGEMACDVDAKPLEQGRERAVQVEAVPASPGKYAKHACDRIDRRRRATHDVEVLVRNGGDMRALQRGKRRRIDLVTLCLNANPLEIRSRERIVERRHRPGRVRRRGSA